MKFKISLNYFLLLFCGYLAAAEPVSNPDKNQFRFFINADPQMGPENTEKKGLKILNELLENFVAEVNQKNKEKPVDFVVYNGDLVWDPYQDAFDNFTRIVSKQEVPVKLVHGNHDGYNDDPKFFEAQKKLSGYQKLNYSFDYGNWHFVVVGAQEKYLYESQKEKQLNWLKKELSDNKHKQVMLFMHYHIMPVGLSQMEFYTYWPIEFKNQMLDLITEHGNVKYVFNGHVHVGVKASVKSSLEYKGTRFVNSPTPVMARPFGEEFSEFEDKPKDRFFRRGFYLEVVVDGDEVNLIGHKINHKFKLQYPKKLKQFKKASDPRFFTSEAKTLPNKKIRNPSFNKGFKGWKKSYRYKKDTENAFVNIVNKGTNVLKLKAPWGSWSFDEYMETYQVVELDLSKNNVLSYEFQKPKFSKKGSGGFIKVMFFNNVNKREEMLLLHWGARQEKVRLMYQSWFFNADGDRLGASGFVRGIKENDLKSFQLDFDDRSSQVLDININQLLSLMGQDLKQTQINKVSIAHGVWSRVMQKESNIESQLKVNSVYLKQPEVVKNKPFLMLNNKEIAVTEADKAMPYHDFLKKQKK